MHSYRYYIHDLTIRSELEIPEIPALTADPGSSESQIKNSDLRIRYGRLSDHIDNIKSSGVLFEISEQEFLLKLPNIGKYIARKGQEIIIDRNPEATDDEVRLFLLGSVLGAILHQRGYLPLHGSSVRVNNEAIVIIGNSAAGKSTLAAMLNQKGFPLISDDISSVSRNSNGECIIHPGLPYIKLWKDVVNEIHPVNELRKVRPQIEKYKVPTFSGEILNSDTIVKKIVLLTSKNEPGIDLTEISGANKLKLLRENVYRDQLIKGLSLMENHFKLLSQLSTQSKVFHIKRPSVPLLIEELSEFVINKIIKND